MLRSFCVDELNLRRALDLESRISCRTRRPLRLYSRTDMLRGRAGCSAADRQRYRTSEGESSGFRAVQPSPAGLPPVRPARHRLFHQVGIRTSKSSSLNSGCRSRRSAARASHGSQCESSDWMIRPFGSAAAESVTFAAGANARSSPAVGPGAHAARAHAIRCAAGLAAAKKPASDPS